MIIKNIYNSNIRDSQSDCSLGLGTIIIWILNGLHCCPDDHYPTLAEGVCQHFHQDYDHFDPKDNEGIIPLMFDAGLYFISDIVIDNSGTYCLPFHKAISDKALQDAFKLSMHEVRHTMGIASYSNNTQPSLA